MKRALIVGALVIGCEPRDFTSRELELLETLTGLGDPPLDTSNRYVQNPQAIALGRKLFFDPCFSGDSSATDRTNRPGAASRTPAGTPVLLSCADCHDVAGGGADVSSRPNAVSIGAGTFNVNAPAVINSAYWETWFWSGQLDSMWSVGAIAAEAGVALNGTRLQVAWRLWEHYLEEYSAVFGPLPLVPPSVPVDDEGRCLVDGGPCPEGCIATETGCWERFPRRGKPGKAAYIRMTEGDKEVVTHALVHFAKAIAAYETQLVVKTSPFDDHLAGGASMSEEAIRGAKLFVGKASCIECHNTALFADQGFHNTGVPQIDLARPWESDCIAGSRWCDCVNEPKDTEKWCLPFGAHDGLSREYPSSFHRGSDFSDDKSSAREPRERTDDLKGAWRTASLRNLADTAPYMHNGAYSTLEEVIAHYEQGGTQAGAAAEHRSPLMQPLFLTHRDVQDLVAFLGALNGPPLPETLQRPASPPESCP